MENQLTAIPVRLTVIQTHNGVEYRRGRREALKFPCGSWFEGWYDPHENEGGWLTLHVGNLDGDLKLVLEEDQVRIDSL